MTPKRTPTKATHNPKPEVAEKWRKALQLRLAGATYQLIADQCGYKDHTGARYAIKSAMKYSLQEPAEELRQVEAARLDQLMTFVWPKGADITPQENANDEKERLNRLFQKVDRVVRLMERRSRLMGVDSPVLHKIEAEVQTPPTELSKAVIADKATRQEYLRTLELASSCLRLPGGAGDDGNGGRVSDGSPSEGSD